MSIAPLIAGLLLLLIAAAHSWLGEKLILAPLFSQAMPASRLGPSAMKRILRFAWHITSVAWIGIGLAALLYALQPMAGAEIYLLLASLTLLITGATIYASSRGGHFAWPVFGAATLLLLYTAVPESVAAGKPWFGALGAVLLTAAGLLHLYWAAGGKAGLAAAISQDAMGQRTLKPRPLLTALIGLLLLGLAIAYWLAGHAVAGWPQWLCIAAGLVFALRLIGEGKYVGILKRQRGTAFARRDDALYGPVLFVLAATAALIAA